MASDENMQANTAAINNLAEVMITLGTVAAELNKNLMALAGNQASQELHGQCHDRRCSNREMHNHGVGCGINCSCDFVVKRRSRQFNAYIDAGDKIRQVDGDPCRDQLCENAEHHAHGKACGKSCSESTCVRE